jgi:hypothetical protein
MPQCRLCQTEVSYLTASEPVCAGCQTNNIGLKILQYYADAAQRAENGVKNSIVTNELADHLRRLCELDHNKKTPYATVVQSWLKKLHPFASG